MKVLVVLISLLSFAKSQKNLSPNGTASQSSTYHWKRKNLNLTADLAITGGRTHNFTSESCSATLHEPTQYVGWWMVTFPVNTVYVTNVLIDFQSGDGNRLAGYSLFVSNSSTSKIDGYLCYHHTGTTLPDVFQNVTCNHLGQYVIFYNERKKLGNNPAGYSNEVLIELCNVEVNGCYKGWWDSTCSTLCPVTCVNGHCYPGNGSCVWGCNSDNCLNDICDAATGKCTQGCKIGLRGDYCDKVCESGTFGNQCSSNCHCVNQPCDHINGACPDGGCQRGYKGITCSTECILGHYGYNCEESCDGCLLDSCDREHGVCTDTTACKLGRQPGEMMKCDKTCGSGTFGIHCSRNCHCVNQPCDPEDGTCHAGGCERGYEGITCSTECASGNYGYNCEHYCRICVHSSCERYEGFCTNGCIDRLKGLQCQPAATPLSAIQATHDIAVTVAYAVIGTFIVTTLVCAIIFMAILRYRRHNTDGNTKKHSEQRSRGFNNGAFTNDYPNTIENNTGTNYEDTISSAHGQEEIYDTI